MAAVQFVLSRELPRTAEQISDVLIITDFTSLLKGPVERNDSEQLYQYRVLEYFTLPHFLSQIILFY